MTEPAPYPPLHKTITVPWTREAAFRRFTEEISSWWPYKSHSVGGKDVERLVFEGRVGGEIGEVHRGGARYVWGKVVEWQPPSRVVFTWHPGQDPSTYQDIEVRFSSVAGGTRLELIHTGWERLGKLATTARRGYPIGWTYVLNYYAGRTRSPLMLVMDIFTWTIRLVRSFKRPAPARSSP